MKNSHKNTFRPTSITIENFKGFGEPVTIPLKPITLLFGKNSAGKSTILQALLYLGEVLKTKNGNIDEVTSAGKSIKLGGFENIVHGHDSTKIISIKIDFDAFPINWKDLLEIDEFIIEYEAHKGKKAIELDASKVGDFLKKGSIEFKIGKLKGNTTGTKYTLISTDIYFDEVIFARIGQYSSREDLTQISLEERIILNEIHPLFGVNDEKPFDKNNNILHYCKDVFESPLLNAYLKGESLRDKRKPTTPQNLVFKDKELIAHITKIQDKEIANSFKKADFELFNDYIDYKEDTLRMFYDDQCQALIEIGQCSKKSELKIHQIIRPKVYKSDIDIKIKYTSTKYCPTIDNQNIGTKFNLANLDLIKDIDDDGNAETDLNSTLYKINCKNFFIQFLSRFCFSTINLVENFINQNRYIGPIREIPSRNHIVPLNEENSRWGSGLAAWDLLLNNPIEMDVIQKVNNHLTDTLKISYTLERATNIELPSNDQGSESIINKFIKSDKPTAKELKAVKELLDNGSNKKNLYIRDKKNNVRLSLNDIGVGISQVIPVVVGAISNDSDNQPTILSIEQPELHLHPGLQCNLADLFIKEKNKSRLFLLETHSEHLILRFLRRIREANSLDSGLLLKAEDLSVLYIFPSTDGLTIVPLEVTAEGDFEAPWPNGFFEERDKELY